MSYAKDRDAHTRGVNAIAAVDGVGNRLRRREAAKAHAMARRDRALATVASRAFKASSLGAVPTGATSNPLSGQRISNTLNTYLQPDMPTSGTGYKPPTTTGGGYLPPVVDIRPTLVRSITPLMTSASGTWSNPLGTGGQSINPTITGGIGTGGGGTTTGTGTSGGGGVITGGHTTGGGGGGGGSWTPVDPGGMIIDDDGNVVPASTGSGLAANKKYLLYAALALGAYWLWRRSKKGA